MEVARYSGVHFTKRLAAADRKQWQCRVSPKNGRPSPVVDINVRGNLGTGSYSHSQLKEAASSFRLCGVLVVGLSFP